MALPDTPVRITRRGDWPGPITYRRGWARATARRWNDVEPDASLRLVRGSSSFLSACVDLLAEGGAPSIISPPLPPAGQRTWTAAGFEPFIELALMRVALDRTPTAPSHLVVESDDTRLADLLTIDAAAFSPFWRFDELGLREAINATSRSLTLVIRDAEGGLAGYAVVGFGTAISYLQRVAVHPRWQGQGMGRSLIRVAARRARNLGAKVMLLNTQLDNDSALGLYEQEGYVRLPEPLHLVRFVPSARQDA